MKYWYLIGQGIGHSRSPGLWNSIFEQQGIDVRYELLDVAPEELPRVEQILAQPQTLGANITMPFKAWAYERAEQRDSWAQLARTANVLDPRDGALVASNTDVQGIIATLQTHPNLDATLIVGAGGVAKATLGALKHLGHERIFISCRNPQRFAELMAGYTHGQVEYVPWEERGRVAEQVSLVVNATSLGMDMNPGNPLPDFQPRPELRVLDAVYRDGPTEIGVWCESRAVPYASGIRFLVGQGEALIPYFNEDKQIQAEMNTEIWSKLGNFLGTWEK